MPGRRVSVYVDGFNLYYRALQKRPACKWLDIRALCERMLDPKDQLVSIKYFTARILPRPTDPSQTQRQEFFLRALATTPHLTIIEGRFSQNDKRMFLASSEVLFDAAGVRAQFATVVKLEEKGSDVNLASHLLLDGFEGSYDLAVLISADTDLAQPLQIARVALKKRVAIFLRPPFCIATSLNMRRLSVLFRKPISWLRNFPIKLRMRLERFIVRHYGDNTTYNISCIYKIYEITCFQVFERVSGRRRIIMWSSIGKKAPALPAHRCT